VEGQVEVFPEYVAGLRDLAGFERIWLLFWCDRAITAQLEVVPYRDTQTRGIFATRAPSRPNPIGMSSVRLLGIKHNMLRVADVDMLDGTPLLDIKPYLPECDVFPVERIGWCAHIGEGRLADNRFMRGDPDAKP